MENIESSMTNMPTLMKAPLFRIPNLSYIKHSIDSIPSGANSLIIGTKILLSAELQTLADKAKHFSLILEKNTLNGIDENELVQAFRSIPPNITSLYLSDNILNNVSSETLKNIFAITPTNINTIGLICDFLNEINLIDLSQAVAFLPKHVKSFQLYNNSIEKIYTHLSVLFFQAIPPHITTLNLSATSLDKVDRETLFQIFQSIPSSVSCLNLSENSLYQYSAEELLEGLAILPRTIKTLDLGKNDFLQTWSEEDFIRILSVIPKVTSLNLSDNSLREAYQGGMLASIMESIPSTVELLDLSYNDLGAHYSDDILNVPELESQLALALEKIPPNVTSLILKGNGLGAERTEMHIDLIRSLLSLPRTITLLDLSDNNLDDLDQELSVAAFTAIPDTVSSLILKDNRLINQRNNHGSIFKKIPHLVTCLDLRHNLTAYEIEFSKVLTNMPYHISSVLLSDNYLCYAKAENVVQILKSIPSHVTSLDLSYNYLAFKDHTNFDCMSVFHDNRYSSELPNQLEVRNKLILILKNIPDSITSLDLSGNQLGLFSGKSLNHIFKALPPSISNLKLKDNLLFSKNGEALAEAFEGIPSSVTALDLSNNLLGVKRHDELYQAIAAIHSNLEANNKPLFNLSLCNNSLFNKEYNNPGEKNYNDFHERDELLESLGLGMKVGPGTNSSVNLSFNGESDFQRAFAPLISLCSQKEKFSEDLVLIVISFLIGEIKQESRIIMQNQILEWLQRPKQQSEDAIEEVSNSSQPLMLSRSNRTDSFDCTNSDIARPCKKQKQ